MLSENEILKVLGNGARNLLTDFIRKYIQNHIYITIKSIASDFLFTQFQIDYHKSRLYKQMVSKITRTIGWKLIPYKNTGIIVKYSRGTYKRQHTDFNKVKIVVPQEPKKKEKYIYTPEHRKKISDGLKRYHTKRKFN